MLHRIFSTIIAVVCCIAASAQGTCVINGDLADCTVADGKKIKKVALVRTNENGQEIDLVGLNTAKHSQSRIGQEHQDRSTAKDIEGFVVDRAVDHIFHQQSTDSNNAKHAEDAKQHCGDHKGVSGGKVNVGKHADDHSREVKQLLEYEKTDPSTVKDVASAVLAL